MGIYSFGPFRLEVEERRLLREGQAIQLRGKIFDTLCVLVANRGRLMRKDELLETIWPNSAVEENSLDQNISHLRKALADGKNFKYIETVPRQGYRFVAEVAEHEPSTADSKSSPLGNLPKMPRQEIQYFTSDDGAKIAYSIAGSGPPLVKAANYLNHLDFEWKSPIWAHWVAELTRHHTLIRYDERGNGLSSWNVTDFSFEAWVRDFEKLMEIVGPQRVPILGISQGGAVAIAYAARHPERVSQLILYGSFARGWSLRGEEEVERRNALLTLVRLGWGKDHPAFRQTFSMMFMPEGGPEQIEWFNELQRISTSPENAVELLKAAGSINIVDLLPEIQCPTIVLHSRDDVVIPFSEGRLLASRIRGAKMVELPSRNHLVIPPEPAWEIFIREVGQFLGWDSSSVPSVLETLPTSRLRVQ